MNFEATGDGIRRSPDDQLARIADEVERVVGDSSSDEDVAAVERELLGKTSKEGPEKGSE
ncbi:hypothetical protein A3F56_00210 [Candidatus Kaiserbacteria bacterium RIFCSPHIGHO2_12_FULL_55_13]|uniref:Uncharacterized protein n=1 Tax=Candidatus Kaiserbacteria bacterium RIFCSPHIGHO2_01_FULL_54_36b TaxID=1798483 RepID=A0A1F6CJ33_9BACT|nr:MAG: hypothetical protein A2704_01460 [Candidatus Kaiserbacteria bacterium RIFCSPHIGHO2_01_FULL_54_36b]OGG78573.1 MAG: hypothetical protein A3F56_00210 [Candidatus Kaiserbacteria bacterium RIFCSPHIGHO2_12_FULL_55_13]